MSDLFPHQTIVESPTWVDCITTCSTWVAMNGYWYTTVNEHHPDENGVSRSYTVYTGHYTVEQAENAYQAMMLALSDWRNSG